MATYTAQSTISLRSYALAAIAAQIGSDPTADAAPELHFLREQALTVMPDGETWIDGLLDYLRRPGRADRPLLQLAAQLGLSVLEVLSIVLAAAVEDEILIGRAIAWLQVPLGGSRPTLGLLASAFAPIAAPEIHPITALVTGPAVTSGLLTLLGEGTPLPERAVSIPLHLYLGLQGMDGSWPGTTIDPGSQAAVPLPHSIAQEAQRQAHGLNGTTQRVLVLRTGSISEGHAVAGAIATALQRRALFIETDKTTGLGPWLMLRQLVPVFCFRLAPGERRQIPSIPGYQGPVLALCGPDGSVEAAGGAALSWTLAVPSREERQTLWQTALGNDELAAELARNHRHGSGRIAHIGRLAHHRSTLNGQPQPTAEDVVAAAWISEGGGLDGLAQPLTAAIPDEALVLTPTLRNDLNTLLLRCRVRDRLVDGLGASATARYYPGVRVLFVGPSGTGKTLAAGWLATRLGLPLYRVDLASVTSKYIGETEKNLAQLLALAEQSEVVLLFDEADSLFGKRTDVKEANDRFANAQTNYLLQRIESFDGITVLTSNNRSRFDAAFSRRLDAIVDFALPGPEERRSLWQTHLGGHHVLTPRQINQLAAVADMGGGHIRNAVLTAAVLAQDTDRPISFADVVHGLQAEYKKLGRQMPVELRTISQG